MNGLTLKNNLNGNEIKLLALIFMLIDHIGGVIIEGLIRYGNVDFLYYNELLNIDYVLRFIGRLSFPLFCFFISAGVIHTKNKFNYLLRLLVFAIIAEIPFDIAFNNTLFYFGYQNVMFELFLGALMLVILEKIDVNIFLKGIVVLIFSLIATLIKCDYTYIGIILIAVFYIFKDDETMKNILSGVILIYESFSFLCVSVFSLVIIKNYNGERGKINIKYLFYAFYPIHLLILSFIRIYVFNIPLK